MAGPEDLTSRVRRYTIEETSTKGNKMETENSEVYKMIHEGAEVHVNGEPLGNGEVEYEVETPYEEAWYGEMGPSKPRPAKRTFKITMPEVSQPLREDWIIKRYASDGSIKEATFSGQEEAQRVMQLFRDLGLEGHFELVCRPRAEDVVVTSYRNEPEEEPLAKSVEKEEDGGFDREKSYRDDAGDTWSYLYDLSDRHPGWYFQEEEGGPHYGPFPTPLAGPHEEVMDEGAITDPGDLLKSKRYLDRYGCVWEYRIHQGNDRPDWHFREPVGHYWNPIRFSTPVDGPWTEYEGES